MADKNGFDFNGRNVYIDYSYMKVMFRWDYISEKVYVRPYGEPELAEPVPHHNKIFTDATLFGSEISEEEYLKGK